MVSKSRVRVGSVAYLNARPLTHGIEPGDPLIELTLDVPSALAEGLKAGRYDVALIPVIEYFRGCGDAILPGIAIASHGPVQSVCLFSKRPISQIRRVGLDPNSRTSCALVQILLAEQYGLHPTYVTSRPDVDPWKADADATLFIGDRALQINGDGLIQLDLGEAWRSLTGLPFVYACWVVRRESVGERLPELIGRLRRAKRDGLAQLDRIAREAASELDLPTAKCAHYLKHLIRYDLGEAERIGMQLFHRYAIKHHLAPKGVPLLFAQ